MIIEIKVIPSSGKQGCILDKSGMVKCFLKSAPENGAANKELIKQLSKLLKIPQVDIEIVGGLISRKKRLKIAGLTEEQFWKRLGLEDEVNQSKLF